MQRISNCQFTQKGLYYGFRNSKNLNGIFVCVQIYAIKPYDKFLNGKLKKMKNFLTCKTAKRHQPKQQSTSGMDASATTGPWVSQHKARPERHSHTRGPEWRRGRRTTKEEAIFPGKWHSTRTSRTRGKKPVRPLCPKWGAEMLSQQLPRRLPTARGEAIIHQKTNDGAVFPRH